MNKFLVLFQIDVSEPKRGIEVKKKIYDDFLECSNNPKNLYTISPKNTTAKNIILAKKMKLMLSLNVSDPILKILSGDMK